MFLVSAADLAVPYYGATFSSSALIYADAALAYEACGELFFSCFIFN